MNAFAHGASPAGRSEAAGSGVVMLNDELVPAWYCARTKPKHEHIAAADLATNLGLEVFHPTIRIERATRRGVARLNEPLFPGYLFVRCRLLECRDRVRYARGIATLVNFAGRIPRVPDSEIGELKAWFDKHESASVAEPLLSGEQVVMAQGVFFGMHASVLHALPAKSRVRILLDILGHPTTVEVDRCRLARQIGNRMDTVRSSCPAGLRQGS